ncbi:MAG: hypothetical protein HY895_23275 [Deltaproteobacteria bacterium]|nr:hypothetical protein [Deltaproteobacteria bacterium]
MDETAAKLLQELGDSLQRVSIPGQPTAATAATATAEDLDRSRMLLVEMVYLLNACFRDVQYWEGIKTEKDTFRLFGSILLQLARLPGHDGVIRVSHRGAAKGKLSEKADYLVRFGDISIDTAIVAAVIKRLGIRMRHLEGRLQKSFDTLAAEGIDSILLRMPDDTPESMDCLRGALRVLSCYRSAAEKDSPITYSRNGKPMQLTPVRDDQGLPDPNLTMLAAVNELPAGAVEDMVRKVSAFMQRPENARLHRQFPNVYQTLFAIKSLRDKLQRPPIEVNASRRKSTDTPADEPAWGGGGWADGTDTATAVPDAPGGGTGGSIGGDTGGGASSGTGGDAGGEAGSRPSPDGPTAVMGDAAFRESLTRLLKDTFKDAPAAAAGTMRCVYGQDYGSLDAGSLGERLGLITNLLTAMQANPAGQQLMESALQRVQAGMGQLPSELLNDLVIDNNVVKVWEGDRERIVGKVEEKLAQAIDTAKDHAAARRTLQATAGDEPIYFSRDAASLAAFFDLAPEEMEAILKLFRGCFDGRGGFQKTSFEKKIPEFARYHKKIFKVLWEFLKDMPRRNDRLPFLNSLQFLIREIKQPIQAVRIMLADFMADPAQVSFPDRNAIMLSTQFLRTYNKEINVDIELTPEEILRVHAGLDGKVMSYAVWRVNSDQKRFLTKVVSIRKRLMGAFGPELAGVAPMPPRFLIALEREVHIFLALIGGNTAASILHSALNVFGNPESQFYITEEGRQNLYGLLRHLSVLVRGIGRVGSEIDLVLLDQIKHRENEFLKMSADPRYTALVRRTFGWVEPAKSEIAVRSRGGQAAVDQPTGQADLSSTNTLDL